MSKRILDPCCGSRMFWFDKNNPDVEFCDNRELHTQLCDGRKLDVRPDTFCDFTSLPFEDESYYHVVFDPPTSSPLVKIRGWHKNTALSRKMRGSPYFTMDLRNVCGFSKPTAL